MGKPWEQRAAESDLKYWGYHKGKMIAAEGWPKEEVIQSFIWSPGDSDPGYKIPIPDMPPRAWEINRVIMTFPDRNLSLVLEARYCVPPDYETGRLHSQETIAKCLGMAVSSYQKSLTRAKVLYKNCIMAESQSDD